MIYRKTVGKSTYAESLTALSKAELINKQLGKGEFNYYLFEMNVDNKTLDFDIKARPFIYQHSSFLSFYIDETSVLRGADKRGQNADEDDPPIKK